MSRPSSTVRETDRARASASHLLIALGAVALACSPLVFYLGVATAVRGASAFRTLADSGQLFLFSSFVILIGMKDLLSSSKPLRGLARAQLVAGSLVFAFDLVFYTVRTAADVNVTTPVYRSLGLASLLTAIAVCLYVEILLERTPDREAFAERVTSAIARATSTTEGVSQQVAAIQRALKITGQARFDGYAEIAVSINGSEYVQLPSAEPFEVRLDADGRPPTLSVQVRLVSGRTDDHHPVSPNRIELDGQDLGTQAKFDVDVESSGAQAVARAAMRLRVDGGAATRVPLALGDRPGEYPIVVTITQATRLACTARGRLAIRQGNG